MTYKHTLQPAAHFSGLPIVGRHESDSQHKLLGIVIIEDTSEVISKMGGNLVRDLLHGQFLVCHPLPVQLQPEQPWGYPGHVEVWHFIVNVDKLLVLGHHCVERVWVVVDGRVGRHLAEGGVLDATQHILVVGYINNNTIKNTMLASRKQVQ